MALARAHGVCASEPRVVRDLSNVLVALDPAPLIARVATTTAAARPDGARDWLARDVSTASFLAARGAAVVPPAIAPPPGPHEQDGLMVTFWRLVEAAPRRPSPGETGSALQRLHGQLEGYAGALPPLGAVLDEAQRLIDRLGLRSLSAPLRAARSAIEAAGLPARPLHGDAHSGNLLCTASGLLWTDFEDACFAPLEWDLACLVAGSDDPGAALAAYGYEGALTPFVEARRLQVAAWTAFMAEHHPQLRARAQERLRPWERAT